MPTVHLHNTDIRFEQGETHDTLLRAGLSQGIGLPYECNSGGCGSCKFELLDGEIEELWPDAPALTPRDIKKGRKLACQCRALGDITIRMPNDAQFVPLYRPRRQHATLVARRDVTADIIEFRFHTDAPAHFLPGQYAMLTLNGARAPRAYSMSNLGNDDGIWDFWIRRKPGGEVSEALFASLHPGDSLLLDGPYGLAHLQPASPRDVLCIAGGSGISPVLSIARGLLSDPTLAQRRLHFFFGARTPADICGLAELQSLPGFSERAGFHVAVSEPGASDSWHGATGFIHELVSHTLGDRLATLECYLAGPPPMVQATTRMLLLDHQVPQQQVHFDRFF
ncbi:ferredoxin--NAD(+) reductase FAD/NAD(P)-binding protein [Alcanivorax sp. S71-1-4]|uniref:2Fe-2S iron-sulfur cluster-binding protein n=1 Tax=Alcanivorax sp. S71-1-4 TaxID=1177159 RepID=UPI001357B39F|nr:2Fe-2S iron-sulfur cluster-binding protein [Alcanivorax sp. S71-1-4]KAF0807552.1 ferredoxin--NAD(+) reductase FAD/NAD(P)-binding protein [Alcanivorax sp. S71-1-4]